MTLLIPHSSPPSSLALDSGHSTLSSPLQLGRRQRSDTLSPRADIGPAALQLGRRQRSDTLSVARHLDRATLQLGRRQRSDTLRLAISLSGGTT